MSTLTLKVAAASLSNSPEASFTALIPFKFLPLAAARIVAAVARAYRIRRDTRQVMALSDHMLKDIGIGRSEIGGAVRLGCDLA